MSDKHTYSSSEVSGQSRDRKGAVAARQVDRSLAVAARIAKRRLLAVAAVIGAALVTMTGCPSEEGPSPRERSRVALVREERPGQARLAGIGPIRGFAKGRDNTFMHCLELVLEAIDRPTSYDELMGLSGLAFRVQFRVDQWDVGNADPLVGEDCLPTLFAATGWEYETWVVRPEELAEKNALREAVNQSIDRSVPVLAANIIPPEDWGIITGYKPDRTWLCRSYNGGAEREDKPAKGWPSAVVLLTRRLPKPDQTKIHVDSLRRAVALFDKRAAGSHSLGAKAFDDWCQSLRTVRDEKYVHANFWTYIGLIDARGAAVRYLRSIAKQFGPREVNVNTAADWYDREVQLLIKGLADVPSAQTYATSMPPREMRERQVETLRQAQAMEKNAIDSLRKAL